MEPHQQDKCPWQPEDTRHKDIQVVNAPDDYVGPLPLGYPGSGDIRSRHTDQARGEPIARTASPTISTLPQPKMRNPPSSAEMTPTPNTDRPRAGPFIPADYVKLRKPWEEEMRGQTPSYAAMEIKVRELKDNSMFSRTPTDIPRTVSRAVKCEWCGKTFSRAGALPRHQSSCPNRPYHLRTPLFTCLECGETRPRKDKMRLHCQRKHGQEWGNARFMETTKEQLGDKGMATFSTEGNAVQACLDNHKPHSPIKSPQNVEPASSWDKRSQTPDSTGIQLECDDVLGFSPDSLYPSRASGIESYLLEDTLKDQVPGDLSRLSREESVLPNSRPLDVESVISSDDRGRVADANEDYFVTAETYLQPVDNESHMSFHDNSTFSIPFRTTDEQPKSTTTQEDIKPGLPKPEQLGTIDMSYTDSESDVSVQRSSIFSGQPKSAHEQSTLPTTHDNESGLQKFEQPANTDISCADSIQSDGCVLGLDATAKVRLSSELVSMIFAELGVDKVPDDLTTSITNLLYDCAAVLQRRVRRDDIGRQVAIFIRHRRNMIARQLSLEKAPDRAPGLAMDFREKIAFLMSRQGVQGLPDDIDLSNIEDLTDEDEMKQPDVQEARAFLAGSAEFAWLLVRLKALCQLEVTGETYTSVRQTICRSLEQERRDYSFSLDWCPLAFLKSQYPSGTQLSQVICVSGNATRAQATTCEQYVTQTWPDIGPAVLKHLDKYIESESLSLGTGSAQPNFELHIQRLPNDSTCIRVIADPNVVLEIGEVLSWLVVACRASDLKEAAAPTSVLSSPGVSSSLGGNFEISWASEPLAQSSNLFEETCWHDLFNSCSIAQGYPIPRRTHNEPGLELSLGLMSMLGAASRAVLFDSVLLLKGLCSMFVPLQKVGASVVWHYLVHRDEYGNFSDWMPHYEASHGREPLRSLDFSDLVDCPQYVGWSRETKMVAGSKDARYDEVDFGGKPIKPGFALDGVSISISKVLSVGTKAVAGKKDTPMFQCASGPYEQTINITAKWTALMYDTAECRGWLLDGATALLHMCRAAMTHPDAPEIGRGLPKSPVDAFTYAGASTDAKDILRDKQNRELIIYDDKEKPWTFEDLVLQHWSTFEEMKSHHFKLRAGETKQWEVSNPLSRRLEGFGFVDILTREPCMPRYHSLSNQASQWLQFTTQCGAINILGSGFGDLIAPLAGCKKTLQSLPCGHDLIAAPVGLLHRIARRIGMVSVSSIELCDGVYWNDPLRSFASDPCQCIESSQKDLMWRCGGGVTNLEGRAAENKSKRRRLVDTMSDYSRGAIILGGRSSRFGDRLCVETFEAQVPVSPQSPKRKAPDEGYSSSRS